MDKSQRSFITAAAFAVCISAVSVSSALAWLQPGSPPSRPAKTAWTIDDNTLTEGTIREGLAAPTTLRVLDAGNDADALVSWTCADQQVTEFIIHRQRSIAGRWLDFGKLRLLGRQLSLQDTPGLGTFRYRVASATPTGNSAFTDWAAVDVERTWTVFTPSTDTRIVYVSSSGGSDANDGLSESRPKATIAAGYTLLRHGYPDWLLLRRGDTWTENLGHWRKSGRSETQPMLVSGFGPETPRPQLRTGTSTGFTRQGGGGSPQQIENLAIVGLDFLPHLRAGTESSTGLAWLGPGGNILVEDCRFTGYSNGITVQQDANGRPRNITVRRSIIVESFNSGGSHSQGLYAFGVDGLRIEENLFDRNGWNPSVPNAQPTIFNHNIYIATDNSSVSIDNNFLLRASSHGVQLRAGGNIRGNVLSHNPIGILLGGGDPVAVTHTNGVTGTVSGNVVLAGTNIADNLPRAFGIDVTNIGLNGAVISDNLIANKIAATSSASIHLMGNGYGSGVGCNNIQVRRNTIFNWRGPITVIAPPGTPVAPSRFASVAGNAVLLNDIQDTQQNSNTALLNVFSPSASRFENNRYASLRTPGPLFTLGVQGLLFEQWRVASGDTTSVLEAPPYADPSRSLAGYAQLLGGDGTVESFCTLARSQSRAAWRAELAPKTVRAYLRGGFGLAD